MNISNIPTAQSFYSQRNSQIRAEYKAERKLKKRSTEIHQQLAEKYFISQSTVRCIVGDAKYPFRKRTKKTTDEPKNT